MPSVTDINDAPGAKPKAAPRPPRATTTPKPRAKVGERDANTGEKVRTPQDRRLITELSGIYQMLGLGVGGIGVAKNDAGLMGMGNAMAEGAEGAASAWMDYADQNPAIKRAIARLTQASAVGSLVAVHVAMTMPLLVDRGILKDEVAAMAGVAFAQAAADPEPAA